MSQQALFHNQFFEKKPFWIPQKLYRVVCNRSNPRTKDYMARLADQKFQDVVLCDAIKQLKIDERNIVLLYPDSIGIGFFMTELRLFLKKKSLTILNGRGRVFELTAFSWICLLCKRFLESTFLPEFFLAPIVLIVAFLLTIKDKLVGHNL